LDDDGSHETCTPPEFPLFTFLPAELRFQIWRYALPEGTRVCRVWNMYKQHYELRRPVPSLLQVCREAREWFIGEPRSNHSSKSSSWKYQLVHLNVKKNGGVYVNWLKDDIYITQPCKTRSEINISWPANSLGHSHNPDLRTGPAPKSPSSNDELGSAAILDRGVGLSRSPIHTALPET
jgi:hypothetical protein